jgi:ABC-type multidrug transport system ATPase subunit
LIEELSCRDNLKLWCDIPIKEFLDRTEIKRLGIGEYIDKRVSTLSGGMKRRLAIAIALVSRPPILILDEPGTALDIKGRAEIADYLKAYTASGGTVVMTTHIESEIALCTKLFIMKDGVLNSVKTDLTIDEITSLI